VSLESGLGAPIALDLGKILGDPLVELRPVDLTGLRVVSFGSCFAFCA
jgi:hypothetical protein